MTIRPDPARWLWYAYGGRLPDRYREWVRRDTTGPRWLSRHLMRVVVEALPVLVVAFMLLWVFTPVSWWAIVGALLLGLLLGLWFALGTARELVLVRLAKHGFPPDVVPPRNRMLPEDASYGPR
ncbi:MAG TPA: DUF5313 family protein [Pseudonocardiaceae bacterium]|nr:DUF5313 family protein [Pseudonocardiaceae bacterium]